MDNATIIEKTFESAGFLTGGELNPEQQDQFVVYVKKFSRLLGLVRFINMKSPKMDIDKMHISEPVTTAVAEGTPSSNYASGQFNQVSLAVKKVRSAWNITTEALQSNIERDGFEDTLMETMTERIATDLELLGIQGDVTTYAADASPTGLLLRRLNGWDLLTDGAHILDVDGLTVSKNMFAAMLRAMPKQFKQDPGLRWIVGDTLSNDWMNLLAERGTAVGDAALQGTGLSPFGRPMVMIPLIPDDKALAIVAATPAMVDGNRFGPFLIEAGTNDEISIDNNAGSGPVVVTLSAGVLETVEVARQINVAIIAGGITDIVVEDNGEGNLRLRTNTQSVTSKVIIAAGTDDALPTLGLVAATTTGSDAGTAGDVLEGTFALLTNPMNLIFGLLAGTRVFSEFNKDIDQIETVVFNQLDVNIENVDAVVKAINIRRQAL